MNAGIGMHVAARVGLPWTLETLALLDEQHLAAWSDDSDARREFSRGLVEHLCAIPDAEVLVLDGSNIFTLDAFCHALEIGTGLALADRSIDARGGVIDTLRSRGSRVVAKRRFILWLDAHAMLAADHLLFGRLADALIGTAAENEMVGEDLLLIQRVVFIGRASLDLYALDPRSQFQRWYAEGAETPLWRVVAGVERPRVRSARVESLLRAAH